MIYYNSDLVLEYQSLEIKDYTERDVVQDRNKCSVLVISDSRILGERVRQIQVA